MKHELSEYARACVERAKLSFSSVAADAEIKLGRFKSQGDYILWLDQVEEIISEDWIDDEQVSVSDFELMQPELTGLYRACRDRIKKAFSESLSDE
jgi:hypothetical protein